MRRQRLEQWLEVGSFAVGVLTEALAQLRDANARPRRLGAAPSPSGGSVTGDRSLVISPSRPRPRRRVRGAVPTRRRPGRLGSRRDRPPTE